MPHRSTETTFLTVGGAASVIFFSSPDSIFGVLFVDFVGNVARRRRKHEAITLYKVEIYMARVMKARL